MLEGRQLVDGGITANLPIGIAQGLGADRIIAVDISVGAAVSVSIRIPTRVPVRVRVGVGVRVTIRAAVRLVHVGVALLEHGADGVLAALLEGIAPVASVETAREGVAAGGESQPLGERLRTGIPKVEMAR